MRHILLERPFVYKKRKILKSPEGFVYNNKIGAWVEQDDDRKLLVKNDGFPSISTKKNDIETGEDQKGH